MTRKQKRTLVRILAAAVLLIAASLIPQQIFLTPTWVIEFSTPGQPTVFPDSSVEDSLILLSLKSFFSVHFSVRNTWVADSTGFAIIIIARNVNSGTERSQRPLLNKTGIPSLVHA